MSKEFDVRKFDIGEDCMQRHLYEHFQSPGHTGFLQETFVTFFHKTDPRAPTKREDYMIHNPKTKMMKMMDLMLKVVTEPLLSILIVQFFLFLNSGGLF